MERLPVASAAWVVKELVATGKLRPRESVAEGIESAPEAFLGLLKGRNFGKQLVRVGPDKA